MQEFPNLMLEVCDYDDYDEIIFSVVTKCALIEQVLLCLFCLLSNSDCSCFTQDLSLTLQCREDDDETQSCNGKNKRGEKKKRLLPSSCCLRLQFRYDFNLRFILDGNHFFVVFTKGRLLGYLYGFWSWFWQTLGDFLATFCCDLDGLARDVSLIGFLRLASFYLKSFLLAGPVEKQVFMNFLEFQVLSTVFLDYWRLLDSALLEWSCEWSSQSLHLLYTRFHRGVFRPFSLYLSRMVNFGYGTFT